MTTRSWLNSHFHDVATTTGERTNRRGPATQPHARRASEPNTGPSSPRVSFLGGPHGKFWPLQNWGGGGPERPGNPPKGCPFGPNIWGVGPRRPPSRDRAAST